MKTHQSIMVVTLSCLLLLISACEKKSVSGVSGMEDLLSSKDNHEVAGDDLSGELAETSSGDGWDAGRVEALSATDLDDGKGEPAFAWGGQESSFKGAVGMEKSKDMSQALPRGQVTASGSASGNRGVHDNARGNGKSVAHGLRDVFFAYDSWRLSEQSHRILEANAKWLKAHPHARVTIEGHCDERGTRAYNYVLGDRRAEMTKQYLFHLGVPAHQLIVISYGKDQPLCHVFSKACFKSNRRAHFSMDVNMASRD